MSYTPRNMQEKDKSGLEVSFHSSPIKRQVRNPDDAELIGKTGLVQGHAVNWDP